MSQGRSRRWPRFLIVGSLSLALVGAVSPTASAQGASGAALVARLSAATDPAVAFAEMSPTEQQLVQERLQVARFINETPVVTRRDGGFGTLSGGCWGVTWGRSAYSTMGIELFSLKVRIDWCGNGSTLTSVQRTRWPETYVPCYSGTISQDPQWGGVGQWSYRSFVQADFSFVCPPIGGHWFPWLDMTATAAGGMSGSGGGT